MTRDDTETFLADMDQNVRDGNLPELNDLTEEQKDMLLRCCRFIDTPEKRKAVATVISEMGKDKSDRAFSLFMKFARAGVTLEDFVILMWSVPGAVIVLVLYFFLGGEKQVIIDIISGFLK